MKRIWLTLWVFSIGHLADAKTLLVSDIDDTIKVSHVLSTVGKVSRAADVTTPFLGMAALYQLVVNEDPQNTKVVYLSNAPDEIVGVPALKISHQTFLVRNHFPAGDLLLRDGLFEIDHKLKALRTLIENEKPDLLILIGDNGERDTIIYDQVSREYANLNNMKVLTFIHQLYSTKSSALIPDFLEEVGQPLKENQTGFVTPIEIGLKLNEAGRFSTTSLEWMILNIAPAIVRGSFPSFKDCSDFRWKFSRPQSLHDLISKIDNSCN